MYRLLSLFVFGCLITACANSQTTTSDKTPASAVVKETAASTAIKTSVTSTARPTTEPTSSYPFDIPLTKADGSQLTSAEALPQNGKPTVVLFWLTTCMPCQLELKALHEKYATWQAETDFNLVAISTDFQKNYPSFVKKVTNAGWGWETYHDTNREFRNVMPGALNGLPQTFIFDKDGNIVYHKRKYRPGDENTLYAQVKQLASR